MNRDKITILFRHEFSQAKAYENDGDYTSAFHHYERAHIISQRWLVRHWRVHWAMLRIGRLQNDPIEVRGQIRRLAAIPFGWVFGWVPKGNSGGANVSPIISMDMPPDIRQVMEGFSVWKDVLLRLFILGTLTVLYLVLT